MYEDCPEAHEKWLWAENARRTPSVIHIVNGVIDENAAWARLYDRMAFTAWQAHKAGVCSCPLRQALEKRSHA